MINKIVQKIACNRKNILFSFTLQRFIEKTRENERQANNDFLNTSVYLLGQLETHQTLTQHVCTTERRTTHQQLSIQNATIPKSKRMPNPFLLSSSSYLFYSYFSPPSRAVTHSHELARTGSSLLPEATYICWLQ